MVHVPRWCNSISISEAELKSNSQHFFNENGNLVISQMVKCFLIGKGEVHRNAAIFLWHEAQSEATLFTGMFSNNKKNPQSKTSRVQLISKYSGQFSGFQLTISAFSLGYGVDCNSLKLQAWEARIISRSTNLGKSIISVFC